MVLDVGARVGIIAQVATLQASTPNRLRRYEGAAHAERCSRPTAPPSCPDGTVSSYNELSTWAFIWLACLWLACLWRFDDGGVYRVLGDLSGGGEITEPHVESKLPLSSLKHARKKGNEATGGPPVRWFVIKTENTQPPRTEIARGSARQYIYTATALYL